MRQLPAPETIFGRQELTQEDTDAQGSRFRDVKAAIFANPYQTVWGDPNAPPLPHYQTTKKSVYAGSFPGGRPQFKLARSERWIPPLISVGEKMARLFEDWCAPAASASQASGPSPQTTPIPAISNKAVRV